MAGFFPCFPVSTFEFDGRTYNLEDLTRHVVFDPDVDSNSIWYEKVQTNGERPDVLANILYSNSNYWWTFFVINNRTLNDWYLDEEELEALMSEKFSDYDLRKPYRWLKDGVQVPQFAWKSFRSNGQTIRYHFGRGDGFQLSNPADGVTRTVGESQSLSEYIEEKNFELRFLKVVKRSFISEFFSDFRTKLNSRIQY